MKSISKLACLSGGLLLGSVFLISMIDKVVAEEFTMPTMTQAVIERMQEHRVHLKNLWLGDSVDFDEYARLAAGESNLNVLNGLFVGEGTVDSDAALVVVGGGSNNIMNGSSAGIAGGASNTINANNSAIGGGVNNTVNGENGVVAGGTGNMVGSGGGVIVGGGNNISGEYGVVVGGFSNTAGKYGLAFGRGSRGGEKSFSWNDGTEGSYGAADNSAYIGASGGVLIGTYTPIAGVNLVVSGAVKIGGKPGVGRMGEVKMINGCFYAHDGNKWHILGKSSAGTSNCRIDGLAEICEFGNTRLWEGDTVIGYSASYAPDCSTVMHMVTCGSDGNLDPAEYIYPYCYSLNVSNNSMCDRADLNNDTLVNEQDYDMILSCMSNDCYEVYLDINGDNYVDAADGEYILNMMVVCN